MYYSSHNVTSSRRARIKKRRRLVLFSFLLLCSGILIIVSFLLKSKKTSTPTKQVLVSTVKPSPAVLSALQDEGLESAVETALEGTKGSYGVYIKNLKTNVVFMRNDHISYDAASLYKLWIMGVAYNQIESGRLKKDQTLSQDVKVLNEKFDIASEAAEMAEGKVTLTVSQALEKMITISDNYAALLLAEKVRLSTVGDYLKEKGLNESTVGTNGSTPKTTASDVALFFEKLYRGELGNADSTESMFTLLKNQRLNNKIPKNLPDGTVIAHKTGELYMNTHDAGIVYTEKGDYIIVVLSKSDNPEAAEGRIGNISEGVFNFFN